MSEQATRPEPTVSLGDTLWVVTTFCDIMPDDTQVFVSEAGARAAVMEWVRERREFGHDDQPEEWSEDRAWEIANDRHDDWTDILGPRASEWGVWLDVACAELGA